MEFISLHFCAHLPIVLLNYTSTSLHAFKKKKQQQWEEGHRKKGSETLVGPPTVSHCEEFCCLYKL